ncbi:hypothetical protein VN97_g2751 [Penicillium thymicola]|uniref:Uncharacterized protein n=1 Tax=Penicillium thymicola TaxID=293382 RepID=A0AAI9XB54_PENTH|nr:hypothetical protein VN97_g2751 [Penicillium thymicola]
MESLTGKKLTEDQNLSKIQDQLGNQLDGVFGKAGGGVWEKDLLLCHETVPAFSRLVTPEKKKKKKKKQIIKRNQQDSGQ